MEGVTSGIPGPVGAGWCPLERGRGFSVVVEGSGGGKVDGLGEKGAFAVVGVGWPSSPRSMDSSESEEGSASS